MLRHATAIAVLAVAVSGIGPAQAQNTDASYPSRPIKIIACVPAGGGVDTVTRIVAEALQRKLGQPVIVENRGGGAGNIGTEAVFHAEPDGYTLLAAQPPPLTINAMIYRKLNFDPAMLQPIAVMTTIANVLLVRPDFPAKTAAEFVSYAKANPGKINYASQGIGTTAHLTAELFAQRAGLKLTHVPYRGTGPALNDLIASHVDMMFVELASSLPLHRGGKAHIIAVAADQRLPDLAEVPTLAELGLANFRSTSWNALAAPPMTPRAIVEKLNTAVNEVIADPQVRARFSALSLNPQGGSTAQTAAFLKNETRVWAEVIKAAGVKQQ